MKYLARGIAGVALACVCAGLTGCQTYGESAGLGGLIGAAAGAVIGHQSGEELEGAAIGAAVGAAVGAIAKDQEVRNERERAQSGAMPPEPILPPADVDDAETLLLEEVTVFPAAVRRGEIVDVSIRYGVYNSLEGVRLKESRSLYKDGREVETFASNVIYRANGSCVSSQQFRVASRLVPGVYEIVQSVEGANAHISGRAAFRIE